MASQKIRGLKIELQGDASPFIKAMGEAQKAANQTTSKLKDINKALKVDPKNTDLLKQKQETLNKAIEQTKTKLDEAKKALDALQKSPDADKNKEAQDALQREIVETEAKLKELEKEAQQFGSVGVQQAQAFGHSMEEAGQKIEAVGDKLMGISAASAAALGGSVVNAAKFEDGMNKLSTLVDTSSVSIDDLSDAFLNLSTQTGKSAEELAEAGYQALSASVDVEHVVGFVEQSSKLAKAGFLDTAGAVDVLTTIINAYGMSADDAAYISDVLIQTQNDGKTTVEQLAASMGTVIPTASAYGVGLENLSAAYALMTKQGINTANATTYINAMMTELANTGSDVSEIIRNKTGKTFGELMQSGASLGDVLSILYEHVDGNSEAFANLWGNMRAGKGALPLVDTEAYNAELAKMESATGNTAEALDKLVSPTGKARKTLNALKNTTIELGQEGLEMVTPLLDSLLKGAQKAAKALGEMDSHTKKNIVKMLAFGAALGPAVKLVGSLVTHGRQAVVFFSKLAATMGTANLVMAGIAVGITAITAAVTLLGKQSPWAQQISEARDYRKEVESLTDSFEANRKSREESIATSGAEAQTARDLAAQLDELRQKENLSNEEKQREAALVEQLNGLVPNLNLAYDEQSGALSLTNEEITKHIDNLEKEARAQAAQTALTEAYEEQIELERKRREASEQYTQAVQAQTAREAELQSQLESGRITAEAYYFQLKNSDAPVREAAAALGELDTALSENSKELEYLSGVASGSFSEVGTASGQMSAEVQRNASEMVGSASATGRSYGQNVARAIAGTYQAANTAGRGLSTNAKAGASTDVNNGGFRTIGGQMGSGIVAGLSGSSASIQNTARSLATSAVNAMKSALGIHSPSRVMRDVIGKNIGLGIADGIEDSTPSVVGAVLAQVQEATQAYQTYTSPQLTMNQGPSLGGYVTQFADSVVSGFGTALAGQAVGDTGDIVIPVYLYPGSQQMDEITVRSYDRGKARGL